MSLRIRLARGGAKKRPYFRIVVADSRKPRDGRYIERLGTYNPLLPRDHDNRVTLNEDRIRHWLSVGARPSDRVHRFLDAAGILKREPKNNPIKGRPGQKRLDREEAKREAEAKAKEEAEAAPAEEAPAEEAAEQTAEQEAAAESAQAGEAKAEETPSEEAKAEEPPAEDAPAEEPKAEAAPVQDSPSEETAGDAPAAEEGEAEKKE